MPRLPAPVHGPGLGQPSFGSANYARAIGYSPADGRQIDSRDDCSQVRSSQATGVAGTLHDAELLLAVEGVGTRQRFRQTANILRLAYHYRSERLHVLRLPLNVQQATMTLVHYDYKVNERNLGGVSLQVKHRFTGEEPSDRHAVETSNKAALVVPDLDRMGPAEPMKRDVGFDELIGDPPVGPVEIGAGLDHRPEVRIDRHSGSDHRTGEVIWRCGAHPMAGSPAR